jgi:hypothetical protein
MSRAARILFSSKWEGIRLCANSVEPLSVPDTGSVSGAEAHALIGTLGFTRLNLPKIRWKGAQYTSLEKVLLLLAEDRILTAYGSFPRVLSSRLGAPGLAHSIFRRSRLVWLRAVCARRYCRSPGTAYQWPYHTRFPWPIVFAGNCLLRPRIFHSLLRAVREVSWTDGTDTFTKTYSRSSVRSFHFSGSVAFISWVERIINPRLRL